MHDEASTRSVILEHKSFFAEDTNNNVSDLVLLKKEGKESGSEKHSITDNKAEDKAVLFVEPKTRADRVERKSTSD